MFDIGFFELIVIGILALLVLGPERLPKAARTAGMWIGRIKQGFSSIQQEVNQQLHMEEMQRQLEENRRKLEETLRQQEKIIADSTGPGPAAPENQSGGSSLPADEHKTVASAGDEGPFGTTPVSGDISSSGTGVSPASADKPSSSSDQKGSL